MGDRLIVTSLLTRDITTQGIVDLHEYFKRDSNPRSECSSGPRSYAL